MTKSNLNIDWVLRHKDIGYSNQYIAELNYTSEASVRRLLKKHKKAMAGLVDVAKYDHLNELDEAIIVNQWDDSGGIAVTADWHIPLTDFEFVNTFLSTCKRFDTRTLIIAGDYLNGDTYSSYFPKQANAGVEYEKKVGVEIMDTLLDHFERIVFLKGNHDYRYVRARDYTSSFVEIMYEVFSPLDREKLSRIEFSNLDNCWVNTTNRTWYVCHAKSYSRQPGTVARQLASKHHCSVITGHSHHCAMMYAPDGRNLAVEIGGFMDTRKTQYLQDSTTFPVWQQGFGIISPEYEFLLFPNPTQSGSPASRQLTGLDSATVSIAKR
jgi:predicted phosphodiesterase